jgi:hypothetical protein
MKPATGCSLNPLLLVGPSSLCMCKQACRLPYARTCGDSRARASGEFCAYPHACVSCQHLAWYHLVLQVQDGVSCVLCTVRRDATAVRSWLLAPNLLQMSVLSQCHTWPPSSSAHSSSRSRIVQTQSRAGAVPQHHKAIKTLL